MQNLHFEASYSVTMKQFHTELILSPFWKITSRYTDNMENAKYIFTVGVLLAMLVYPAFSSHDSISSAQDSHQGMDALSFLLTRN